MTRLRKRGSVLFTALMITVAASCAVSPGWAAASTPAPDRGFPGAERQPAHGRLYADGEGDIRAHRHGERYGERYGERHGSGICFGMDDAHRRTYLLLLAQKYAPETAGEWEKALAETERLRASLRARVRPGGKEPFRGPDPGFEKRRPEAGTGEDGTPRAPGGGGIPRPDDGARSGWRTAMRSFDDAVRSGSAPKIRTALADLLAQTKLRNAALKRKLESVTQQKLT